MRVLALDTTTRAGSVAIVDDGRVIDEREGDAARTHAERLPGEILARLDACHLTLADIDLFAVASGPGSFTGLRIGIATMQGLAFVGGRRIVGVAALDALAQLASESEQSGAYIGAWIDAHRRDVFAALYSVTSSPRFEPERLIEIEGPTVGDPSSVIARWRGRVGDARLVLVGDGATLFADLIAREAALWDTARTMPPPLLAGAIGQMALARARRGETVDPAGLYPLYIRRPDAEVARDRGVAH
jgi:tRNA threonylcarbamoyladenosine biosynthesis protein TsaB